MPALAQLHSPTPLARLGLAALLVALGLACARAEAGADGARPAPAPPAPSAGAATAGAASWREVDRLIDEQKLAEAVRRVETIETAARAAGDDAELAKALVRQAQLAVALGGYESAVEALRAKTWPSGPLARVTVELYDAQALAAYLDAYSWEVRQRERVVAGGPLDLKLWTRDQIAAEIDRAFGRAWALREELGTVASKELLLLAPNDYPEGIRPTLRDAVAYLWAERLADSSGWSPEEMQELWKLDRGRLVDGDAIEPTTERLGDESVHPLAKLSAILGDLERWHRAQKRQGAALEARLERLRLLHDSFEAEEDRAAIRAAFERSLPEFRRDPWWAMGMARLASLWRQADANLQSEGLIRARTIALEGERAYPGSPGEAACRR
jgi:hypothetical protein